MRRSQREVDIWLTLYGAASLTIWKILDEFHPRLAATLTKALIWTLIVGMVGGCGGLLVWRRCSVETRQAFDRAWRRMKQRVNDMWNNRTEIVSTVVVLTVLGLLAWGGFAVLNALWEYNPALVVVGSVVIGVVGWIGSVIESFQELKRQNESLRQKVDALEEEEYERRRQAIIAQTLPPGTDVEKMIHNLEVMMTDSDPQLREWAHKLWMQLT